MRKEPNNPRMVYSVSKQLEMTLAYSYEKYEYTDARFESYQYTIGTGATTNYLSGIYAFPAYQAHIVYGNFRCNY